MIKKLSCFLLALALVLSCTAAVAENELNSYKHWEPEWPIVKEGDKPLTISVAYDVDSSYYQEPEKTWFWIWSELATGLKFNVRPITQEALAEQTNLMFASDNLPDVMIGMKISTGELMRYGMAEGQLLDLSPYINEENMPYLTKWFEKYPMVKTLSTTPDGAIYSLPGIILNSDYIGSQETISYNMTWLRELEPSLPEIPSSREDYYAWFEASKDKLPRTLDEFTAMLRAFKEKHPESVPLGGIATKENPLSYLLNAFGYLTSPNNDYGYEVALREGKVVIPATDDTFFEFLKLVKMYYEEGLICKDFFTADKLIINAQMTDNQTAVIANGAPYGYLPLPEDYHKWDALFPLTSPFNPEPQVQESCRINVGGCVLSAKAQNVEEILKWLDFFYSDLGIYYLWCGPMKGSPDTLGMVEGFYYDLEKGAKVFPDVVKGDYENSLAYVRAIGFGKPGTFGNRSHSITDESYSTMMEVLQHLQGIPDDQINRVKLAYEHGDNYGRICSEVHVLPYVKDGYPPIVYYSEEDQDVIDEITLLLNDFIESEVAKFITGANELTEESFQKFVKECKAYGADELQEIYERAYNNYLNAL